MITPVLAEFEHHYRAVQARDSRFDGWFYTAVTTTGVYCRPSCPAVTPKPENVRFFATAAAAQLGGFRACMRCRPDAAPGSPEWDARADLAGRAMRLIADGVVDREGVPGLSSRLGYTPRHLRRRLTEELGAGPVALARAQRAQTARILIETTDLPFADVAFAADFSSVRQFNETIRSVLGLPPRELRRRASNGSATRHPGEISLRLAFRRPLAGDALLAFLAARAVPGLEEVAGGTYRRSLALPHASGTIELSPGEDAVHCVLRLEDLRDLGAAVRRARNVMDLDADPEQVDAHLAADPLLAPMVRTTPGRRVPGAADGAELATRAVLGQQVSVPAARTLAGRLVSALGRPLASPLGGVTTVFPGPGALAEADDERLPLPRARREALRALSAQLADGAISLEPGADREEAATRLLAVPGVGDWTVQYIRMRALRDPDAFPATDHGVRLALRRLGERDDRAGVIARAERWRPWRAHAVQHLWGSLAG